MPDPCRPRTVLARGLLLATWAGLVAAHELPHRPRQDFVAPAAGSYRLNAIQPAPDGPVLDSDGAPRRLAHYVTGAVTLLSFVYTYCVDAAGCPLAHDSFVEVRRRILAEPHLHGRTRLVSLSFDPVHDTPAAMRLYAGQYARSDAAVPWFFLTTASVDALLPLLDGFGQEVAVELDERGQPSRTISHMLKVFLIDRRGVVREIYSTAFLLPEVMLNDVKTLVLEDSAPPRWGTR